MNRYYWLQLLGFSEKRTNEEISSEIFRILDTLRELPQKYLEMDYLNIDENTRDLLGYLYSVNFE